MREHEEPLMKGKPLEILALNISDNTDFFEYQDLLDDITPGKRASIMEFRFNGDRLRTLFGELLLRYLIMSRIGLKNHEITFILNDYNKPFLAGQENCFFNLSHAGEWVVAAIDSKSVGIDVERVQDFDVNVSQHIFPDKEHTDILSHDQKADYFFTLWALKESFIKMLGKGTAYPLSAFSIKSYGDATSQKRFHRISSQVILEERGKLVEGVYFAQYHIHEAFKMGVCALHDAFPEKITSIEMESIIRFFRQLRTMGTAF